MAVLDGRQVDSGEMEALALALPVATDTEGQAYKAIPDRCGELGGGTRWTRAVWNWKGRTGGHQASSIKHQAFSMKPRKERVRVAGGGNREIE